MDSTAMQARILARAYEDDRGYATPCWISTRCMKQNGYTVIGVAGVVKYTHRVAYEAFRGAIPAGLVIDHLCRVRECCNPDHLEPVTTRINLLRGDTSTAREAATTHCPRGHPYDEANTYRRPDGKNKRDCRTCRNSRRRG